MKLLPMLNWMRCVAPGAPTRPGCAASSGAALPAWFERLDEVAAESDDGAAGCGWFESSDELRAGLVVTELAAPESSLGYAYGFFLRGSER